MKKKITISIALILAFFTCAIPTASAHILKVDNDIGVVLHIDPEDDPIINQPAYFFFEFKDKTNKFKLEDCDCKVQIKKENTDIYSDNLVPSTEETTATISFAFPEKGIYTIQIVGKPKSTPFQPFTLIYDLRVERENASVTKSAIPTQIYEYGAIGGIILLFFTLLYFDKLKTKLKKVKRPPTPPITSVIVLLIVSVTMLNVFHATNSETFKHSHQSHSEAHSHKYYPCCMPQIALTYPNLNLTPTLVDITLKVIPLDRSTSVKQAIQLKNKSPPATV